MAFVLRRPRRRRGCLLAFLTVLIALFAINPLSSNPLAIDPANAQARQDQKIDVRSKSPPDYGRRLAGIGDRVNANTVAIISGNLNATYLTIAYDLSAVLDNGDDFRILPVIGKGGGQNIKDVRFLRGVDLGITQSNLLNAYQRSREIGTLDDKIVYVAKLFNEEMHVVVRADSGITSLAQLDGRKVNFSDVGSGSQLSSRDVFARLEIKPIEVNMGQADAIEKLKSGEIAATVLIAGKPAGAMARLKASDGFRFLTIPFSRALQADYLPATFGNEDYPNMVAADSKVDTIAVGAVLIAYNWPRDSDRYRRIQSFVDNFFPRLAEFQKPPRHPKWMETNLAATLPGWTRFAGAEEWLQRNGAQVQASRDRFDQFLAARKSGTPEDRERLFQEFLRWSQERR